MSDTILTEGSVITVSIELKNTGDIIGKEVVQLYIKDLYGSVVRPMQELKGFEKIELAPGQTQNVSFNITSEMLAFTGLDMSKKAEKGAFEIRIGSSSESYQKLRFHYK